MIRAEAIKCRYCREMLNQNAVALAAKQAVSRGVGLREINVNALRGEPTASGSLVTNPPEV